MIKIVIPETPVTKKNHQQIIKARGHYMVIPSKQYREYEKACAPYLQGIVTEPIDYPCEVRCVYYMPTRRRVDLVNLLESSLDILTHYGVLADDNCKIAVSHDGSRVFYDKEFPRTEIRIKELSDYECTESEEK